MADHLLVRQNHPQVSSNVWRRCQKNQHVQSVCANGGSTRKSNAAALRLGRPLSRIAGMHVSALTARTSILAYLPIEAKRYADKARPLHATSHFHAHTFASRVAEEIRVQIWSVTTYMHMARGLVWSIQRPLQGWEMVEGGIRSSTAGARTLCYHL
jgi:hypothetical protein